MSTLQEKNQEKRIVGQKGEEIASVFLQNLGYQIRERNARIGHDEIDSIAFDPLDSVLVFVEVKTRTKNDADFRPELDLTVRKKKCLRRAARAWVDQFSYTGAYRIDVIYITNSRVTQHIRELDWGELA